MSAGSGITHSEFNPSDSELTNLLQIWIIPNQLRLKPTYQQIRYDRQEKCGKLKLIASPNGENGSVLINQDACIYACLLSSQDKVSFRQQNSDIHVIQIDTQ